MPHALKTWRAKDGALKLTLSGLPCDRGYAGSATATIRRAETGEAAGLYVATVPTRLTRGGASVEVKLSTRAACEAVLGAVIDAWMRDHVVAAWSDGACAIVGHASQRLWELDARARERRGLAVYRGDNGAARGAQGAAA